MTEQKLSTVTVAGVDDGIRLDKWLKKHYPALPFGVMQKLLRTGQVRIDGKRAKPDARIAAGQEIRVPPIDATSPDKAKNKIPKKLSDADIDFIRSLVIYEDDDVIAINKPHGIAVQGGSKVTRHIDGLLDGLKRSKNDERPRLVHRLDKETSGVLLLARNVAAARALGQIFRDHEIRKYYWAITIPAPDMNEGSINAPLNKLKGRGGERMMMDDEGGKRAFTHYAVMERAAKQAAWVAFWPKTGRTHQIRVHAAIMGTPLLGDYKYGDEHAIEVAEDLDGVYDGIHLHARRLVLPHPIKPGKKMDITAKLSPEMTKTWKFFSFNPNDKRDPFEGLDT